MVLAARKFKDDRTARFHAFQGLYLFAVWLGISWIVRPMVSSLPEHFIRIDHIMEAIILAGQIRLHDGEGKSRRSVCSAHHRRTRPKVLNRTLEAKSRNASQQIPEKKALPCE